MALPGAVNPCDFLFKLASQRALPPPAFEQISEQGPPHMKTYQWQGSFHGITAQGQGRSKKEAKIAAAKAIKTLINIEELPNLAKSNKDTAEKKRKREEAKKGDQPQIKKRFDYNQKSEMMMMMMMPPMGVDYFMDEWGAPGFMRGGFRGRGFPRMRQPPLKRRDYHVIEKHKAIYPKEEVLKQTLELVSKTENSLQKLKFSEETFKNELVGAANVGKLSKGLLLSTDRAVNIVLMCKQRPTRNELMQVVAGLKEEMKELGEYEFRPLPDQAAFNVLTVPRPAQEPSPVPEGEKKEEEGKKKAADDSKKEIFALSVHVTMSSMAVSPKSNRKKAEKKEQNGAENGKAKAGENGKEKEDDEEEEEELKDDGVFLPLEQCRAALAEIRHARWFDARASVLVSCVECIRIIKDLVTRDPVWSVLSDWSVELVVERAVGSAVAQLTPSRSLMRVLEVVSSGIFLPGSPGLNDPCEYGPVSGCELTVQQAEDLTVSAQRYLRMVHFNKIHLVLDMEPLPRKEPRWKTKKNESASSG